MKNKLPCAIVRDLLPSYVEGLTEAETTSAVKEHLESCTDCEQRYEAMTGDDTAPLATEKEVDYLKAVRKKNGKHIILAVVLAVVLVLTGVGIKLFWIGTPCNSNSIAIQAAYEDDTALLVTLDKMNSASTILGMVMDTTDGIIRITAREVLTTPLHPESIDHIFIPLDGVQMVEVFGRIVWQDGLIIDPHTSRLLESKTSYVGDAPALGQLISNMDLDAPHTMELQTAQEPYGVTLHFTEVIAENRRFMLEGNAYILLALVDNLGAVSWDDPSGYTDTLTLEEANNALPALVDTYNTTHNTKLSVLSNVKDYGVCAHDLQLLCNMLGIAF